MVVTWWLTYVIVHCLALLYIMFAMAYMHRVKIHGCLRGMAETNMALGSIAKAMGKINTKKCRCPADDANFMKLIARYEEEKPKFEQLRNSANRWMVLTKLYRRTYWALFIPFIVMAVLHLAGLWFV